MNKRLIIIISALVLLLLIGGGIYYYFAKQKAAPGATVPETLFPTAGEGGGGGIPGLFKPGGGTKEKPKLVRLSDEPVAGFIALTRGRIRYAERATGHIYEVSGNGEDKIRISNTTIPRVYHTIWSPKGDHVALSALDEDQNAKHFLATLTGTTTEGVFLPTGATPYAFSATDQIAYLAALNGNYSVIVADPKNQKQKAVYTSPFRDFIVAWPADNIFGLATKPSGTVGGYLYKLDTKTNTFNKVLGGITGLEALWSPDAENILISKFDNRASEISASVVDKQGIKIKNLGNTLATKCAWSRSDAKALYCAMPKTRPSATYPDDWYKGKVALEDDIQKLYLTASSSETILTDKKFDVTQVGIDARDEYLYFLDKTDWGLWGLKLTTNN
ncbi:MAG: hypothetical protein HZA25_03470 [Candidatus Niyogibacteria bacterium]|nr:hypothetical protein [Candidatus Niyogibacteria bacterium]